ncbi:hypothetical protein IQ255_15775 [Pleurocapsales cyanobacterium LEGE 10410]|nr:hypothetical protein [Pleurocapsales cyanobacterium LEGE 10410]
MNTKWRKIILKILGWLLVEAVFNLTGIDDLIDCSEYALTSKLVLHINCLSIGALDDSKLTMKIDACCI